MRRRKTEQITITLIEHRTRWQALDLLMLVHRAIRAEQYGTACELLGMNETLFDELTLDEVAQAMQVRVASLAREAGIKQ